MNNFEEKFNNVKGYLDYYDKYGQKIVEDYAADLDGKVEAIQTYLNNIRQYDLEFDVPSLQKICIDLSTTIYYTNDKLEKLNLLADMSKIKYKAAYNESYTGKQEATTVDKRKYTAEQLRAIAEQDALEEELISFIYNRAAAVLKSKIESANEILKSCSKSLSAEIQSMSTYAMSNKFHS